MGCNRNRERGAYKLKKKLRQNSGETFVEALAAITITVLSIGLLSTAVMSTMSMNKKIKDKDMRYKEDLQKAECLLDEDKISTNQILDLTFTYEGGIQTAEVKVDLYGEDEGMFVSYTYEPEVSP